MSNFEELKDKVVRWAFERAQAVNSNSQLYKQAGNSSGKCD